MLHIYGVVGEAEDSKMPNSKSQRTARAELVTRLEVMLAEMAEKLPDSDASSASSVKHRIRPVHRDADGRPSVSVSFWLEEARRRFNDEGQTNNFWNMRYDTLAGMRDTLMNKRTPADDDYLEAASRFAAVADGDIAAACELAEVGIKYVLESRYFIVDEVDLKRGVWRRIHSSNPRKVPLTKDRPLPGGLWAENLFDNRIPVLASNIDILKQQLPDYDLFRSLDCYSNCYIPISYAPECSRLEILTLLGKTNFFTAEMAEQINDASGIAWTALGLAHTGLYLKDSGHMAEIAEIVPVQCGEDGLEGDILSLIRERAPSLIRDADTMDSAQYMSRIVNIEAEYQKYKKLPLGIHQSELEETRSKIACIQGDMNEACRMIEETASKRIRSRYFAIEEVDLENGLFRRIHSSKPDELPVTDMRPIPDGGWARDVLLNRTLISDNDMRSSPEYYPDQDLISSLGCQSCVYYPICQSDMHVLLGILTFFDIEGFFSRRVVNRIKKMNEEALLSLGSVRIARDLGISDVKGFA